MPECPCTNGLSASEGRGVSGNTRTPHRTPSHSHRETVNRTPVSGTTTGSFQRPACAAGDLVQGRFPQRARHASLKPENRRSYRMRQTTLATRSSMLPFGSH
jgi:hypothetical protein